MKTRDVIFIALLSLAIVMIPFTSSADLRSANKQVNSDAQKKADVVLQAGVKYLTSQIIDGKYWGKIPGTQPGYTSLIIGVLLRSGQGITADDDIIRKPVEYLLALQQKDGGIYDKGYINYNTSVAIVALADARDSSNDKEFKKKVDAAIDKAVKCIRGLQFGKDTGPSQGGIGYGSKQDRSDLSNTQYALEALKAAGVSEDDPVFKEALKFIERCQNNSETNPQEWARDSGDDGGFIYHPGNNTIGPESKGGVETLPNGKKRYSSYGSMTYAGIKSLIFCGVKKDDPRMKAAFKWVAGNYTLSANPGMPKAKAAQGLFYYYQTFAKALYASGVDAIKDKSGKSHNWREDVIAKIASLQKADGSWINDKEERWMEGDPLLATAYAMLTIEWALMD